MAKGLKRSAKSQTREDPMAHELFGPIKEELARVAEEKIRLLLTNNRV
jgi:hypothetical protein